MKELNKLPEELRENMQDLAKEMESAGTGVKLDINKISKDDQKVLNEKPPPVR